MCSELAQVRLAASIPAHKSIFCHKIGIWCLSKYGSLVLSMTMLLQFRTSAITLHVTEPAAVTAAAATSATPLRVTQMTGRITFESFARKFCNN